MNKIRLYRKTPNKPRRLIATFQPGCIGFAIHTRAQLAKVLEEDFEIEEEGLQPYKPTQPDQALHVDLTKATHTLRPIAVSLSEHTLHGHLEMIAYSTKYGTIRGKVSPDNQGRLLFISRLKTIWPNAIIK